MGNQVVTAILATAWLHVRPIGSIQVRQLASCEAAGHV